MPRTGCWILGLAFFLCGTAVASADKFGSGLTTDYATQDTSAALKKPLVTQTVPSTPSIQQQTTIPSAAIPAPGAGIPAPTATQVPSAFTAMPKTPSMLDMRKTDISVPNFEEQFRNLLKKQEEKILKKHKTFIESIINEVKNYGMYIVLALVILIVLYAIHKDKHEPAPSEKLAEPEKKSLWDDEF